MSRHLHLHLKIWRQPNAQTQGHFEEIEAKDIPETASFLEMLDIVNESLVQQNEEPIAFDHDCREGICGMCSLVINGTPHGPNEATTTCQLYMRKYKDGDTIHVGLNVVRDRSPAGTGEPTERWQALTIEDGLVTDIRGFEEGAEAMSRLS